jgi:predicted MFS family arabinose efflux permease
VLAADPSPEWKPGERIAFDIPGALTSTVGVTALVYGVIRAAEENDWADGLVVTSLVAAVVLLVAFVVIETRTARPLMPLRLFANRNRSGSYVVMMLAGAGMMAAFFFITMFMQEVLDYSALQAGTAYLPLCAGVITAAQFASRFLPVAGPRVLLTTGASLAGLSLLYLSFLEPDSGYVTHLLPSMVGMGLGMGTVFVSIMATAVSGIAPEDAGIGSAMLNVTQQIGGTIGFSALVTVSTTVMNNRIESNPAAGMSAVTDGWTTALLVAACLLAVAAVAAFTVLRVDRGELPAGEGAAAMH